MGQKKTKLVELVNLITAFLIHDWYFAVKNSSKTLMLLEARQDWLRYDSRLF
jgi:hypothetical protein